MQSQNKILLVYVVTGLCMTGWFIVLYVCSTIVIRYPDFINLFMLLLLAVSGGILVSFIPGKLMDILGIEADETTGDDP